MSEWIRVSDKKPYCSRDKDSLGKLCEAMDKADAYLEGKAQVKYGCHVTARTNGEALTTCAFDFPDPIRECGAALVLKRKEDCEFWKPIQEQP